MVIPGLAPLGIRVELVIGRPAAVLVLQALFRRVMALDIDLHNAPCPEGHVRVDKGGEELRLPPEDEIRAAAHDDAGALFRQLQDQLPLKDPQPVLGGETVGEAGGQGVGQPAGMGGVFSLFPDIALGKAALPGQLLQDLLVIAGNVQGLCDRRCRIPG